MSERKRTQDNPEEIRVTMVHMADGGHKFDIKIDVDRDHHVLDMLKEVLDTWSRCNHKID
jgi:hypothetical protein